MVKKEKVKIELGQITDDFAHHIEVRDNKRILFTAPYGQGKSTFLNSFFEDKEHQYQVIKLYPVHYSVTSNEDIFELIKFDIATQLMVVAKHHLVKQDFSVLLTSQVFLRHNLGVHQYVPMLINAFSLLGKTGHEVLDLLISAGIKPLQKTWKSWSSFHKKAQIDEGKQLLEYINKFEKRVGHVYEMDAVSLLIASLLKRMGEESKTSVLLIDDLDRLDPDHIFRLFNVFSGHFDMVSGDNKFGFDKTIFVCDIDNIYEIYRHKYGQHVDFKGYVDKFYSLVPFHFDSKTYIKKAIYSILQTLSINTNKSDYIIRGLILRAEKDDVIYDCFEQICLIFLDASFINLRSLMTASVRTNPSRLLESNNESIDIREYPILWIFYVLADLVGSWELLDEKFKVLPLRFAATHAARAIDLHTPAMDDLEKVLIELCLPFLDKGNNVLPVDQNGGDGLLEVSELDCVFHYHFVDGKIINGKPSVELKKTVDSADNAKKVNIYQLLSTTYEMCRKKGYCSK